MVDTAVRSTGIGGTDIAAIIGLHPNRQPWDVYAEKTGMVQRGETNTNARLMWGKLLQQAIAQGYSEITGHAVQWLDVTQRHPVRPWQVWTPDFACTDIVRGGDAKNVAWDQAGKWGEAGSDLVPDHIQVQAQWYMSASGWPHWDIAALFGGNDLRIYTIAHDPEIEAVLLDEAEKFWCGHIEPRVAPPIGNSEQAAEYLRQRFPRNVAALRAATLEESALVREYLDVRAEAAVWDAKKESLENAIKQAIGEAEGFTFDGGKITWKRTKDGQQVDWEAVAKAAGATEELITAHTSAKPGYRRLYVGVKQS